MNCELVVATGYTTKTWGLSGGIMERIPWRDDFTVFPRRFNKRRISDFHLSSPAWQLLSLVVQVLLVRLTCCCNSPSPVSVWLRDTSGGLCVYEPRESTESIWCAARREGAGCSLGRKARGHSIFCQCSRAPNCLPVAFFIERYNIASFLFYFSTIGMESYVLRDSGSVHVQSSKQESQLFFYA
ncbi:hypothetical protein F5B19DRAFT_127270 [Rostrohypoxylon terebratum]|nr:hypothetical protein F5B19DRAFT_127270 [Rostrohypoxylon terebratum]